ncbi:MAG: acyl carrier protein [Rhodospirillum sp.]|nr:acyl carrier protein [Rhodospirillum sp.]MCF8490837.1 acyl carrier protein [Rhodospirillum sp.]MCF8501396.1 acyl carrier protein [Rhodospirillum sp.]
MTSLEMELKALIIESLNLEDVTIDDIDSDEALFVDGLGLDSIDALELGVALQKKYGVKVDTKTENVRTHFASVRNLAAFVQRSLGNN